MAFSANWDEQLLLETTFASGLSAFRVCKLSDAVSHRLRRHRNAIHRGTVLPDVLSSFEFLLEGAAFDHWNSV
jgi:hypothetical protein